MNPAKKDKAVREKRGGSSSQGMNTTLESNSPAGTTAVSTTVQPYLSFEGRCEEALGYYSRVLGAEVLTLMRFQDHACPGGTPPQDPNKIMHASFRIGESTLMASDCSCSGEAAFKGISLSVTFPDDAAAERAYAALSDGGKVHQPLMATFFASRFAVVSDRFGVNWMLVCLLPQ
jgi:PhnB protein